MCNHLKENIGGNSEAIRVDEVVLDMTQKAQFIQEKNY